MIIHFATCKVPGDTPPEIIENHRFLKFCLGRMLLCPQASWDQAEAQAEVTAEAQAEVTAEAQAEATTEAPAEPRLKHSWAQDHPEIKKTCNIS